MFDIGWTEMLVIAIVMIVVVGPKDLPRAMRFVGQWVARARGVARHFRSGIDEMIRQAELEEMEKKWAAENERIMREHAAEPPMIEGEMVPLGGPPEAPPTADDIPSGSVSPRPSAPIAPHARHASRYGSPRLS